MALARHSALVKLLELSSLPAALVGPNALKPAALRSSTMPAAIGASGPTTTRSTALALQKSITAAWSVISSGTQSASWAIPAFPGAHQSRVTSGEAAIFQASACSRPPEPSKRICIRGAGSGFEAVSVARVTLLLQGGDFPMHKLASGVRWRCERAGMTPGLCLLLRHDMRWPDARVAPLIGTPAKAFRAHQLGIGTPAGGRSPVGSCSR